MNRTLTLLASAAGFLGVAFGAFGAHGIKRLLENAPDAVLRQGWWETGAKYHLVHALAIGLTAVLAAQVETASPRIAGWLFAGGILLFSGSLYAMTLTNVRVLGAVTPLGGLLFLAGWVMLGVGALSLKS